MRNYYLISKLVILVKGINLKNYVGDLNLWSSPMTHFKLFFNKLYHFRNLFKPTISL